MINTLTHNSIHQSIYVAQVATETETDWEIITVYEIWYDSNMKTQQIIYTIKVTLI